METPTNLVLTRLELLREFKLRRLRSGGENESPFTDRVVTAQATINSADVEELHREVRENIEQQIAIVRKEQRSQVVLLSGAAGAGKSHLLRYFAQPKVAEEGGYLFVNGANDWRVEEFHSCMFDWLLTALTAPQPYGEHRLLERIRAIGFQALDQLIHNRAALRRCSTRGSRRLFGLLPGSRASYETIAKLTKERNPSVFSRLDYHKFCEEVCSRFLAEPSNPNHRYALSVLLAFLFPDQHASGIGTSERVLHWFRRRPDDGYWTKRLGVNDDLEQRYKVADAIKLFIHLFSADLSRRLATPGAEQRSLVFVIAFDQIEGRDELFDNDEDWNHFFAHLSELYNTLPNVLILFPMTLGLRNTLHPKMEQQFRDRIRKDERFVLRQPTESEITRLYRSRIEKWLSDSPDLLARYRELPIPEQLLPFTRSEVGTIASGLPVRGALEVFDKQFEKQLRELVIEPQFDFEFVWNQEQPQMKLMGDWEYTAMHLDEVKLLLENLKADLPRAFGTHLTKIETDDADGHPLVKLTFELPEVNGSWVCVYLARFGYTYSSQIDKCADRLKRFQHARYSMWMVRAKEINQKELPNDRMFFRSCSTLDVGKLRAAKHLIDKRGEYEKNQTWTAAWEIVCATLKATYLGDLLEHARERVQNLTKELNSGSSFAEATHD